MPGRRIKSSAQRLHKRPHLWVNFAWWNLKRTVVSRSNAWMESSLELWANFRFKLVSSAVTLAPPSTASQIWLSASAKVANLKVVQPKSCNTEASFLSRPSTPAKVTRLSIARRSYRPLTSQKGIWTTHHDVPGWIHFTFRLCWFSGESILKHTLQGSNSSPQNWKVRNPAPLMKQTLTLTFPFVDGLFQKHTIHGLAPESCLKTPLRRNRPWK